MLKNLFFQNIILTTGLLQFYIFTIFLATILTHVYHPHLKCDVYAREISKADQMLRLQPVCQ